MKKFITPGRGRSKDDDFNNDNRETVWMICTLPVVVVMDRAGLRYPCA
jgi:hypothetical protein